MPQSTYQLGYGRLFDVNRTLRHFFQAVSGHVLSSYQSFASRLHNMADEKAVEARKKAEELDKEIDEFMDSLKKKSDGKKRELDFKEEKWEEVKN